MMSRRRKNKSEGCLFWFALIVGGAIYLIMTAPFVFFSVIVPLAIFLLLKFIKWLKK